MPSHNLTIRPAVAKITFAPGTTFHSDLAVKPDPDARGIRLAVGATRKTWVLSRRIDGKVRSITLGSWPELPTVFGARDVAKEKVGATLAKTDDRSTGIRRLRNATEFHIGKSRAKDGTKTCCREQINRRPGALFGRPIDEPTLPDLERALRPFDDRPSTKGHLRTIIGTAFRRAAVVRRISPNTELGHGERCRF